MSLAPSTLLRFSAAKPGEGRRPMRRGTAASKRIRPRRLLVSRALLCATLLAIVLAYVSAYRGVARLETKLHETRKEVAEWTAKNNILNRRIKYMASPEYVESIARRELGLVRKDEVLIVLSEENANR